MNINTPQGGRIRYIGVNGHDYDIVYANKFLEKGCTYTVDYVDINDWVSYVFLKEFPGKAFNTVMFDNIPRRFSLVCKHQLVDLGVEKSKYFTDDWNAYTYTKIYKFQCKKCDRIIKYKKSCIATFVPDWY
jgi:hypothetical protein